MAHHEGINKLTLNLKLTEDENPGNIFTPMDELQNITDQTG